MLREAKGLAQGPQQWEGEPGPGLVLAAAQHWREKCVRSSWRGLGAQRGGCLASWSAVAPAVPRTAESLPWGLGGGRGHQLTQAEELLVPGAWCHVPTLRGASQPGSGLPDYTVAVRIGLDCSSSSYPGGESWPPWAREAPVAPWAALLGPGDPPSTPFPLPLDLALGRALQPP